LRLQESLGDSPRDDLNGNAEDCASIERWNLRPGVGEELAGRGGGWWS